MPIYEFYCERCNTIYNFFSRTVNTEKTPNCPHCKDAGLKRRMSLFTAVSGGKDEGAAETDISSFDEAKMEKAVAMFTDEAGKIDENDPRQAAKLIKKLSEATGINMGSGMEEALRRMEGGEDPEKIEEEMGELLEKEEPFIIGEKEIKGSRKHRPEVDETIYEL